MEVKIGTVTVQEPFEVTQTWATASNYTRHEVQPGVYDVRLLDDYWVLITVDTKEVERHWVDRVFTASKATTEHPNTPGKYVFQLYAYQVAANACDDQPLVWAQCMRLELASDWGVVVRHTTLGDGRKHTARNFARV